MQAAWLTDEERMWLKRQLEADSAHAHLGNEAGVMRALLSPKVWMIGAYFLCALTANYAYYFSAPAILQGATGWSVTNVGFLVALFGVAGAVAMLLNGAHSDRTGERAFHCVVPCILMAVGYLLASYVRIPWMIVASLALSFVAFMAMQGPALAVPTQFLAGRAAAAGIAAMNTITMFSGFIGPYWIGVTKDATGTYWLGLRGLVVPSLGAALAMFVLTRSLARSRAIAAGVVLAHEPV
jgi:ACS family tartrate transporter-like MFS transporter